MPTEIYIPDQYVIQTGRRDKYISGRPPDARPIQSAGDETRRELQPCELDSHPRAGLDPFLLLQATMDFALGTQVEVSAGNGGRGVVRFCGATSFAAGKWVGVELAEPKGKNDGTVNGVRYFTCKPSYGVFARPSQVRLAKTTPEPRPLAAPVSPHALVRQDG